MPERRVPRKATGVFTHQVDAVMSENSIHRRDDPSKDALPPVNALYRLFYRNLNMFIRQNICSLPTCAGYFGYLF
jgi:hypothetical protein